LGFLELVGFFPIGFVLILPGYGGLWGHPCLKRLPPFLQWRFINGRHSLGLEPLVKIFLVF